MAGLRLEELWVRDFRSIRSARVRLPPGSPVVLFGPNNSGKSNILRAFDILLGERWPASNDLEDSDFYDRDPDGYPEIEIGARFSETYYPGNYRAAPSDRVVFRASATTQGKKADLTDVDGNRMYISQEARQACQFVLVDASRDIGRQLSYFSRYSLLSRLSRRMHKSLVDAQKDELDAIFDQLRHAFEAVEDYSAFLSRMNATFGSHIAGFEHQLDVDLSAYDPNNYFHGLRFVARDGEEIRSFDEFGTGEQQILLMAFASAYAKTFTNEAFILGIEEPEAHLHPLAQSWLASNIREMCSSGVQVVITTHSPYFLSLRDVSGFVRVRMTSGVTSVVQHTPDSLCTHCLRSGANSEQTTPESVVPFYSANTFHDQLVGFFSSRILLVEGETEYFALPNYFARADHHLATEGIQLVNCRGKNNLCRNYRLFTAYGYPTVMLFDRDDSKADNGEILNTLGVSEYEFTEDASSFERVGGTAAAYFGVDFESYMRSTINAYKAEEARVTGTKPLKAKVISESLQIVPDFIDQLWSIIISS